MAIRLRMLKPIRTIGLPKVGKTLQQGNAGKRLSGKRLQQRRARILGRQPLCVDCLILGRVTAAMELDHTEPLWEGGEDNEANLTPLCIDCHKAKTALEARRRCRGADPSFFDDSR